MQEHYIAAISYHATDSTSKVARNNIIVSIESHTLMDLSKTDFKLGIVSPEF